jgi:hypothetical protein
MPVRLIVRKSRPVQDLARRRSFPVLLFLEEAGIQTPWVWELCPIREHVRVSNVGGTVKPSGILPDVSGDAADHRANIRKELPESVGIHLDKRHVVVLLSLVEGPMQSP